MARETVLITGATSGIGLELAKLFAADKSDLVLVARNRDALEKLSQELGRDHGVKVLVESHDLAHAGTPQAIFDNLSAKGIKADVVVNNAGFGSLGPFVDQPAQRLLDMIQVNVMALTRLCRLFLAGMMEQGWGGILNVGSTAGFQPGPYMAVYYATKAFVLSFTEALAEELTGTKIKVTCLAPGPTATGFAAVAHMEDAPLFRFGVMDAKTVAAIGYRGFRRGKVLVVPGFRNKCGAFAVRLGPRLVVRKIVKLLQS
jgi:uncharacterized protein